jgi:tetratricopeptide (TPR) repeat protein
LTNRAASRIELGNYEVALQDCKQAIEIDPTWTKAYYRKYQALQHLPNRSSIEKEKYDIWKEASKYCESSAWLQKQIEEATYMWKKVFQSGKIGYT